MSESAGAVSAELGELMGAATNGAPGAPNARDAGFGVPDVLPFWFGESDRGTPPFIRDAASRALADGATFYTHNLGIAPLREALCRYVSGLHGATSAGLRRDERGRECADTGRATGSSSFVQQAGIVAAEEGETFTQSLVDDLRASRDHLVHALQGIEGVDVRAPDGAMYLFLAARRRAQSRSVQAAGARGAPGRRAGQRVRRGRRRFRALVLRVRSGAA